LIRAGLPRPTTQIKVVDGDWVARLDMGWAELKVAVEYDGGHHYTDRRQYLKDIRRLEKLQELGWIVVRVVAEDRWQEVIRRVRNAVDSRARMPRS
jgi:very-short-patch-repair endonuclease